ncbi:MAG: VWA domain-containing protein, partial [Planctomycetes bacterium]|nr:VWA domain-containing protein [Planctomycetota bacterium]
MRWITAGAYALAGLLLLLALGSPAAPGPARASSPARAAPVEAEEGSAPADRAEVFVPATARASRPFLLEVAGCDPSGVRLLHPATGGQHLPGPGPFARLRLTLAEEGWQGLEVAAPGCGPLLAWVRVGPPVPIGWSGPLSPFAAALEDEGFRIETGEVLQGDLLVLAGVPGDPRAIERFAREGGGVLLLGREALRAVGREEWSPVEALPEPPPPEEPDSPPESPPTRPAPGETPPEPPAEPPDKKAVESATVTLLLLIDRSGSMAGVKIERAKEAALASAETLDPQDQVAVIAFDASAEEVCALGAAGDRERIRGCVASLGAGGGTRFEPALRRAIEVAGTAPPGIRHVVLLSDGMTEDWGTVDYRTLVRGARAIG